MTKNTAHLNGGGIYIIESSDTILTMLDISLN